MSFSCLKMSWKEFLEMFLLVLLCYPIFAVASGDKVYGVENQKIVLKCDPSYIPEIDGNVQKESAVWILPKHVHAKDVVQTKNKITLVIAKPTLQHSGDYSCSVANSQGELQVHAQHLIVTKLRPGYSGRNLFNEINISGLPLKSCTDKAAVVSELNTMINQCKPDGCAFNMKKAICSAESSELDVTLDVVIPNDYSMMCSGKGGCLFTTVMKRMDKAMTDFKHRFGLMMKALQSHLISPMSDLNGLSKVIMRSVNVEMKKKTTECEHGFVLVKPGSFICEPCEPGHYSDVAENKCLPCQGNMYQKFYGKSSCKKCEGTVSEDKDSCLVDDDENLKVYTTAVTAEQMSKLEELNKQVDKKLMNLNAKVDQVKTSEESNHDAENVKLDSLKKDTATEVQITKTEIANKIVGMANEFKKSDAEIKSQVKDLGVKSEELLESEKKSHQIGGNIKNSEAKTSSQIADLSTKLDNLVKSETKAVQLNKDLDKKLDHLTEDTAKIEKSEKHVAGKVEKLGGSIKVADAKTDSKVEEIDSKVEKLLRTEKQANKLENEMAERLENLKKDAEKIEKIENDISGDVEDMNVNIENIKDSEGKTDTKVEDLGAAINEAEQKTESKVDELEEQLGTKISQADAKTGSKMDELNIKIEVGTKKVIEAEKALDHKVKDLDEKMDNDFKKSQKQVGQVGKKLDLKLDTLNHDTAKNMKHVEDKVSIEIKGIDAEIKSFEEKTESEVAELTKHVKHIEAVSNEMKTNDGKLSDMKIGAKVEGLVSELKDVKSEEDHIVSELKQVESELNDVNSKEHQKQAKLMEINGNVNIMKAQMGDILKALHHDNDKAEDFEMSTASYDPDMSTKSLLGHLASVQESVTQLAELLKSDSGSGMDSDNGNHNGDLFAGLDMHSDVMALDDHFENDDVFTGLDINSDIKALDDRFVNDNGDVLTGLDMHSDTKVLDDHFKNDNDDDFLGIDMHNNIQASEAQLKNILDFDVAAVEARKQEEFERRFKKMQLGNDLMRNLEDTKQMNDKPSDKLVSLKPIYRRLNANVNDNKPIEAKQPTIEEILAPAHEEQETFTFIPEKIESVGPTVKKHYSGNKDINIDHSTTLQEMEALVNGHTTPMEILARKHGKPQHAKMIALKQTGPEIEDRPLTKESDGHQDEHHGHFYDMVNRYMLLLVLILVALLCMVCVAIMIVYLIQQCCRRKTYKKENEFDMMESGDMGIDNAGGDTTVVYGVDPVSSRTSFAQQTSEFMMDNEAPKATNAGIVSQSAAVGTQVSNSGVMTPVSNSGVMTPPMTDEAAPAAKLDKQPINWDRDYGSDQDNSQ